MVGPILSNNHSRSQKGWVLWVLGDCVGLVDNEAWAS